MPAISTAVQQFTIDPTDTIGKGNKRHKNGKGEKKTVVI